MPNPYETSFTRVVVWRTSRHVLVVFLAEGTTHVGGSPHRQYVAAPEGKGVPPELDSTCVSSSKHEITEEVNSQFARRISQVDSTALECDGT
jgi:hypothetical protein